MNELLSQLAKLWFRQYEAAKLAKKGWFSDSAEELWRFLGASWSDLYSPRDADRTKWKDWQFQDAGQAYFKARINLSAKYVFVMAPYVNARVPHRLVSPDRPQLPAELLGMAQAQAMAAQQAAAFGAPGAMLSSALAAVAQAAPQQQMLLAKDQVRAFLIQWLLQWLPGQYGLVRESKMAVIEALVKGMGIVWQALSPGPTGMIPMSEYDTIDNYFIDGDAKRRRDAGFIVRKRRESVWWVAEKYGLDPNVLRGAQTSRWSSASSSTDDEEMPALVTEGSEKKRDVCHYIEIWSRVGLGQRFVDAGDQMKEARDVLEGFGPHVHLAVMEGVPYPLNLPPHLFEPPIDRAAIEAAMRWPIETYDDLANPWPNSILEFVPYADNPYAQSPLEPALPLQVFIDHLYAFVMGAIRRRSKSTVLMSEEVEEAFENAVAYGLDMEVVKVTAAGRKLSEIVHAIDYGRINPDLWEIMPVVERAFEEMTGTSPLLSHGGVGPTQPRSALEVQERSDRAQSRPDEYADCVEAWQSDISKTEAAMARMYVGPEVVAPLFGESLPPEYTPEDPASIQQMFAAMGPLTQQWALVVNTTSPASAVGEFSYTVEAGTGRRKNKQKQAADLQSIGQMVVPFLTQVYMQTGDPRAVQAWIGMMGEALDVNVDQFQAGIPDLRQMIAQSQQQESEEPETESQAAR